MPVVVCKLLLLSVPQYATSLGHRVEGSLNSLGQFRQEVIYENEKKGCRDKASLGNTMFKEKFSTIVVVNIYSGFPIVQKLFDPFKHIACYSISLCFD